MGETNQHGEVDSAVARLFAHLLPYQRQVVRCDSRFTWNCWARQTGKSMALSLRRVLRGVMRRRTQLFLSAGLRQTRELMLKVRQHCQLLQLDAGEVEPGRSERLAGGTLQIRMPNGVRLIGLPARPDTVRGFTGDVLLDEFAMHREDREIWAAIFPTILRGHGELDVASTPKGRDNLFYSLQQNESFARSVVTLPQAIEQGLDIDIDALQRAMGDDELFRQEFLCEFLDESQAFLPHRVIAACEDAAVDRHPDWAALQQEQDDLYAGIDVARRRDFTVIWLWRRLERQVTGNRLQGTACSTHGKGQGPGDSQRTADNVTLWQCDNVKQQRQATTNSDDGGRRGTTPASTSMVRGWVLRCVGLIEMGNAPFVEQQEAIRRVLGLRAVRRCCIDATGMGLPLAEWAQDEWGSSRVEAVQFTAGSKAQMAGQLRRLAEEGRLRIPADETIRNDWHSVQRMVGAGGAMRLDAARTEGGHADRFWAAALGVYAAEAGGSGPVEGFTSGGLRFARDGTW